MFVSRNLCALAVFSASLLACKSGSHSTAKSDSDALPSMDRPTLASALGSYVAADESCAAIVKGKNDDSGNLTQILVSMTSRSSKETATLAANTLVPGEAASVSSDALSAEFNGTIFTKITINGVICDNLVKSSSAGDVAPQREDNLNIGRR